MADQGNVWVVNYGDELQVGGWQMMTNLINDAMAGAVDVPEYVEEAEYAMRQLNNGSRYIQIEDVWYARYLNVQD